MRAKIGIVLAAFVSLAACGTPGAPRPPSLRLPETVRDLAATRQGSTVTLNWTEPARTTDGENIRSLGRTLVCMGVNDFPMTHCDQIAADSSAAQFASCKPEIGKPVTCSVELPLQLQGQNPLGQATYAVEVLNTNGRSAGLSNQVRVPMAPAQPQASNFSAKVESDAIVLTFDGLGVNSQYRVVRIESSSGQVVDLGPASSVALINRNKIGDNVAFELRDRSFEWEKTYLYRVVGISTVHLPDGTNVDVRGEPTPDIKVFAHDVFPPAAPTGLQAVASGVGQQPFIDMTWAPNTEPDLAGYNVYRHEQGQQAVKINDELVKTPSYRDASAERGKTYFYAVTAIDLRGNESSRSQEASETVH